MPFYLTIFDVQKGSLIVRFNIADLLTNYVNISSIAEAVQKAPDKSEELRTIIVVSFVEPTVESGSTSPTTSPSSLSSRSPSSSPRKFPSSFSTSFPCISPSSSPSVPPTLACVPGRYCLRCSAHCHNRRDPIVNNFNSYNKKENNGDSFGEFAVEALFLSGTNK